MSVFLVSPNGLRTLPETLAKTTDAQRARVCVCLPSSLVRVPDRPTESNRRGTFFCRKHRGSV